MGWTHGQNESWENTEKIRDIEKRRLRKTRKTTAEMGGLCEDRCKKGRGGRKVKRKNNKSTRTTEWQMISLIPTKWIREEEQEYRLCFVTVVINVCVCLFAVGWTVRPAFNASPYSNLWLKVAEPSSAQSTSPALSCLKCLIRWANFKYICTFLLLQPFPYLGLAHQVFTLYVLRSCAFSLCTPFSFKYLFV